MTLLENLCKVNKVQGGTIHQYLGHNTRFSDVDCFIAAYNDFSKIHIEFNSKQAFEKLAEQYHITIKWS